MRQENPESSPQRRRPARRRRPRRAPAARPSVATDGAVYRDDTLEPSSTIPDGSVTVGMETEDALGAEAAARAPDARALRSRDEIVAELAAEMNETAQKLLRDRVSVADMKLLNAALKELRYAFQVFARYRQFRKVSTFGSARTPPDHPTYRQAHEFARRLADLGWMVITGAGGGIMRACQEGSGRERSFGINIRLPFEQKPNEIIHRDPKLVNFKYFFTRKLMFVKEADAIALFPGGFGTHDEGFESLTLLQTGKSRPVPVVFIDAPGGTYWQTWRAYVEDHLLKENLISPADMRLFKITDDLDVAIAEITGFYRRYHSSRYVGDRLVIRLTEPLPPHVVEMLNDEFGDIVAKGRIEQTQALPEEAGEPEIAHLPRLVFHFARRGFGRLRMLIDAVNEAG
ncbi:MAG TPA: LOG family protein [Candidatus Binatia bacterium]